MKTFIAVSAVAWACLSQATAFGQGYYTRADEKARGGYRPYTVRSYSRQAYSHAQALQHYSKSDTAAIPKETVVEHVGEVRRGIDATKKELSKLEPTVKDDKTALDLITGIRAHLAKVSDHCSMLDAEYARSKIEGAKVASCCADMVKDLAAADKLHDQLLKHLKIAVPEEHHTK